MGIFSVFKKLWDRQLILDKKNYKEKTKEVVQVESKLKPLRAIDPLDSDTLKQMNIPNIKQLPDVKTVKKQKQITKNYSCDVVGIRPRIKTFETSYEEHIKSSKRKPFGGNSKNKLREALYNYPRIYKYKNVKSSSVKFVEETDKDFNSSSIKILFKNRHIGYVPEKHKDEILIQMNKGKKIKGTLIINGGEYAFLNDDEELEYSSKPYNVKLVIKVEI